MQAANFAEALILELASLDIFMEKSVVENWLWGSEKHMTVVHLEML